MDTFEHRVALVRRPGPRLADGLTTHIEPSPLDLDKAQAQWQGYVDALHAAGWRTIEVPPADDCPDAVFVEDTAVVYADVAVITRPGATPRQPEPEAVEPMLRELGYRVSRIEAPGTLDGGDVLKFGGTVWVGLGGRTNQEGFDQFAAALDDVADEVVPVPLTLVLHLKSAVTALPDGTVIGYPACVDDATVYPRFMAVPEAEGAHVVLLGGNTLLMGASAPQSAALFRRLGYDVTEVDISEYEKLEGCVTCLSVRLRHAPGLA